MTALGVDIDLTNVDNHELLIILIFDFDRLCWLVDTANEFQCDFVLEVN